MKELISFLLTLTLAHGMMVSSPPQVPTQLAVLSPGFSHCPAEGVRVSGELLEARKELSPGWDYWQQCSQRCRAIPSCRYWSVLILAGDFSRHTCELFSSKTGTSHPGYQTFRF